MKKLLTFTVLCLFVLGSMAFATNTRVLTMGEANNIVKDEANIFLYPSTINYYPKLFVGEYNMHGTSGADPDDPYEVTDDLYEILPSQNRDVIGKYLPDLLVNHFSRFVYLCSFAEQQAQ